MGAETVRVSSKRRSAGGVHDRDDHAEGAGRGGGGGGVPVVCVTLPPRHLLLYLYPPKTITAPHQNYIHPLPTSHALPYVDN